MGDRRVLHDFAVVAPQPPVPPFDPIESLEAFAHIGYGGTPPGMITSGWSNTATGQIGGGEVTEDSEDMAPAPSGRVGLVGRLGVTFVLLCVGVGVLLYTRMKENAVVDTVASEPVQVIVAPPPTSELEQVPSVASAARAGNEAEESREPDARKRKTNSGGAHKTSKPKQSCEVTLKQATDAQRFRKHAELERLTREFPQCWKSTLERKKLRMEALFQLGRYKECISLGRGSSNAEIKNLVNDCRKNNRK